MGRSSFVNAAIVSGPREFAIPTSMLFGAKVPASALLSRESIADAGFMAQLMRSNVVRNLAVVSCDVNGLVVFPDNRLVLFCVR